MEVDVGIQSDERETNYAKTLVLFIHGLGGKSEETWGKFPEFLRQDNDLIQKHDIKFFSYPTMLWRIPLIRRGASHIQELANGLKTQIDNKYSHFQSIVLVCHSMGGFIARKYLLDEFKANRKTRVKGLVLFAVPNNGSRIASIANIFSIQHYQLRQLCHGSDFIELLNEDWFRLGIQNCVRTKFVVGEQDKIVNRLSARAIWGNPDTETIIGKNHRDIVKPQDADDVSVLILKNFLKDFERETPNLDVLPKLSKIKDRARIYDVVPADETGRKWAANKAQEVYTGVDLVPVDVMMDWYRKNPTGFFIIKSDAGYNVGNLDILPLKPEAVKALVSGELIEQKITAECLFAPEERSRIRDLHIESFVTLNERDEPNSEAAVKVLSSFFRLVSYICFPEQLERLYAIPISGKRESRSKNLLHSLGFSAICSTNNLYYADFPNVIRNILKDYDKRIPENDRKRATEIVKKWESRLYSPNMYDVGATFS